METGIVQNSFEDLAAEPVVRRVLICHERTTTAIALSRSVQLVHPVSQIDCYDDGFALVDAYGRAPADLVFVGHRGGDTSAAQATDLLLSLFPAAAVIAYGDPDAAPQLVTAVTRGVRGLMLWSPVDPVTGPPTPLALRPVIRPAGERCAPAGAGHLGVPLSCGTVRKTV